MSGGVSGGLRRDAEAKHAVGDAGGTPDAVPELLLRPKLVVQRLVHHLDQSAPRTVVRGRHRRVCRMREGIDPCCRVASVHAIGIGIVHVVGESRFMRLGLASCHGGTRKRAERWKNVKSRNKKQASTTQQLLGIDLASRRRLLQRVHKAGSMRLFQFLDKHKQVALRSAAREANSAGTWPDMRSTTPGGIFAATREAFLRRLHYLYHPVRKQHTSNTGNTEKNYHASWGNVRSR